MGKRGKGDYRRQAEGKGGKKKYATYLISSVLC